MRPMFRSGVLLIMSLWMGALAPAQAAEEAKPPSERELRTAMTRAEKRFFDLYNEVNDDGRHEMSCESDDLTGSRLKKGRTCRTRGESAVGEEAAREYLRGLDFSSAVEAQGGSAPEDAGNPITLATARAPASAEYADGAFADAGTKIQQERADFDKHLQALLDKHPQLRQRFDEYRLARTRYEAARQK